MKDDFIKPILVLALICLIITGAIALLYDITKPMIDFDRTERMYDTMSQIIPESDGFEPVESLNLPHEISSVYRATDDLGYIIIVNSNGFGGPITVIVGINNGGNIIAAKTLGHTETKGIGDYIDDRAFTGQFDNLNHTEIRNIDSITGATITFNAFIAAIELAFDAFESIPER